MNQIVLIALRRPYTFVVMSILIVLFGGQTVLHMPTDVFPNITIPVTSVVWIYSGLLPQQVEGRITYLFERFLTSTVEGIKYIHSHSYYGSQHHQYFSPGRSRCGPGRSGYHGHCAERREGAAAGYFSAHDHASRALLDPGGHARNQLRQA